MKIDVKVYVKKTATLSVVYGMCAINQIVVHAKLTIGGESTDDEAEHEANPAAPLLQTLLSGLKIED